MKVGFLIDRWDPQRGGAERAMGFLARQLVESGHDVRAFALEASAAAPGRFHRVHAPRLSRVRRERTLGPALVAAAKAAGCERTVGIRHLPEVDVYWPHAGAHLRTLQAHRRRSSVDPYGRHTVFLDFERQCLAGGGAGVVVCVSDMVREELIELYPACAERTVVVPNGVDLRAFQIDNRVSLGAELRRDVGIAPEEPLLVFPARDPRLKGLPELYSALATLQDDPWKLLVAGPRHARRWKRIARRAGLAERRVIVRSQVEPRALYAAADLTCMPTWRDTSSFVLLESLASGTPVLISRHSGEAGTLAEPAQGQVLADPADIGAMAMAIRSRLRELRQSGVDRARVRRAVLDRGIGPWLARLEGVVLGTPG